MANSTPVQSIDRVFDIVEALSSSPHGMSLTDLAAAVSLHVSTVHRLLASLSSRGYVQKDIETGKYRLTLKMFEVGSRAENAGKRVVVLEDTSTTGGSPLKAAAALEKAGAHVVAVCVVVDRDTGAKAAIEAAGYAYRFAIGLRDLGLA